MTLQTTPADGRHDLSRFSGPAPATLTRPDLALRTRRSLHRGSFAADRTVTTGNDARAVCATVRLVRAYDRWSSDGLSSTGCLHGTLVAAFGNRHDRDLPGGFDTGEDADGVACRHEVFSFPLDVLQDVFVRHALKFRIGGARRPVVRVLP